MRMESEKSETYRCQVTVGSDEVALDLTTVVLLIEAMVSTLEHTYTQNLLRCPAVHIMHTTTYTDVCARADKGIVAQVAADVGRDDFTVDAIAGNEVFILPWRIVARRVAGAGASSAACHFIVRGWRISRFQGRREAGSQKRGIAEAIRVGARRSETKRKQYEIAQMQEVSNRKIKKGKDGTRSQQK